MRPALSEPERIRRTVEERERNRDLKSVRRALLAGSPKVKLVKVSKVRERDDAMCHLCGKWVDRGEQSLDHVIPLSRGGEHTYSNIKLAHKLCNSRKGDRLMGEIDWREF